MIYFSRKTDVSVKSVYLTAVYRCDQDMIARVNIADAILKEYKRDESNALLLVVIMGV